jgi:hypothetical protein
MKHVVCGRKGLMHAFLITLIILLLAFAIIITWMVRAGIIIDDEADVNTCRATLALQTKTDADVPFVHVNSPFASSCKRRFITIGEETVKVRGSGTFAVNRDMATWIVSKDNPEKTTLHVVREPVTQEVASSVLAESLRRCYTMGLEGDIVAFNRESFFNRNVCLVCDEIQVQRRSQSPIPAAPSVNWLRDYLAKTLIPGTVARDAPETYASFLDYEGPQAYDEYPESLQLQEKIGIAEDYPLRDGSYATIMIRRFGGQHFTDPADGRMTVAVVPTSKLRVLCNYVAN